LHAQPLIVRMKQEWGAGDQQKGDQHDGAAHGGIL
jgi:hypothetical protein